MVGGTGNGFTISSEESRPFDRRNVSRGEHRARASFLEKRTRPTTDNRRGTLRAADVCGSD
jgi:hypothetical protein